MIETIVDPYGKAAFPTVVKCDGCGKELLDGWMLHERMADGFHIDEDKHYCDECAQEIEGKCEFRVCISCGRPMVDGMTDLDAFYTHEECFDAAMDEQFPGGWREVEDDGCDGYYEWFDQREGEWCGTGIFYTTWY